MNKYKFRQNFLVFRTENQLTYLMKEAILKIYIINLQTRLNTEDTIFGNLGVNIIIYECEV